MVSDVDAVIADAAKPPPRPARPSGASSSVSSASTEPKPAPREPIYSPPESTGLSSGAKVLIGFGVIVAVLFAAFAAMDDTKPTTASQTPNFTSSPSTTPAVPAPLPAPRPAAPSRPTEDRPPVGRNNVLAGAQLRYCVAEQIRVDAAEKVVNNYIETHVDRFNAMVGDYNSRCGEFRYRQGSLQGAERAMEPYRSQLEQEGRGRIVNTGTTGSNRPSGAGQFVPDVQSQKPPPDPTILAIQRRLNQLGFNAGTADGYSGQRTVAAIRQFQIERGLTPDGRPTELLLLQLSTPVQGQAAQRGSPPVSPTSPAPPSVSSPRPASPSGSTVRSNGIPNNASINVYGNGWVCNRGFRQSGNECVPVLIPTNAGLDVYGHNWTCNRGFKQSGTECVAVQIPVNGELDVYGHGWTCSRGFKSSGNACVAVNVPENGILDVYGHGWTCSRGYRQSGNTCAPVLIPENGELDVYGHGWTCSRGYKSSGSSCVAVNIPENGELDVYGHGWTCSRGYRQAGNACAPVLIPQNAELDVYGHGWVCRKGFRRAGTECLPG